MHDFPQDATGKAVPYGIHDMGRNEAWVSVGCDHDTPAFAVASLRRWWEEMGNRRYPEARELFITADAGGCRLFAARRRANQRPHAGDVLAVLGEPPLVARAVLGADEGIGPAPALGHVVNVEPVAVDDLVKVGAQILA